MRDGPTDRSAISRLLIKDPARLHQRSRYAVMISAFLHFLSSASWGPWPDAIYLLTWVALPFVSFALGYPMGLVLRQNFNQRRVVIQLVTGVILAQLGWAILSIFAFPDDNVAARAVEGVVNLMVYIGILISLTVLFGLLTSRVLPAIGRRVRDWERGDW